MMIVDCLATGGLIPLFMLIVITLIVVKYHQSVLELCGVLKDF